MQETQVRSLCWEYPLEKHTTPVFLPGEFHGQRSLATSQSMGLLRVRFDRRNNTFTLLENKIIWIYRIMKDTCRNLVFYFKVFFFTILENGMRFFFIWSPQPSGPWKWTWSYSNQIFTINKKALWFLQGTEGQEIPIRWPPAWFQIWPFYQEAILSNLWRRFWKLKGVRYGKTIPKIVKERFHYFVAFFFPFR